MQNNWLLHLVQLFIIITPLLEVSPVNPNKSKFTLIYYLVFRCFTLYLQFTSLIILICSQMLFYIHIRQRRKLNLKRSSQNGSGLLNNDELEQQKKRRKKQGEERQRRQERKRQTLNKVTEFIFFK